MSSTADLDECMAYPSLLPWEKNTRILGILAPAGKKCLAGWEMGKNASPNKSLPLLKRKSVTDLMDNKPKELKRLSIIIFLISLGLSFILLALIIFGI